MVKPQVSIIIPTYNHATFLKKALDSVLDQTYTHWEAIVINNFSTDSTESIVEQYKDPRIKLINFQNQGIIAASRNRGLEVSTGAYIAFLDSDDYWYSQKLEKCLQYIEEENCDFICHGENLIENDKTIATWRQTRDLSYFSLLLSGNRISTSAVVIKKEVLDKVGFFSTQKEFITAEDYELWLRILKKSYKFKFFSEVLGGHLKHNFNQSSAVSRHFNAVMAVVNKNLQELANSKFIFFLKCQAHSVVYYAAGRQWLAQGNISSAISFTAQAMRSNPFRIKNYALLILIILRGKFGYKTSP